MPLSPRRRGDSEALVRQTQAALAYRTRSAFDPLRSTTDAASMTPAYVAESFTRAQHYGDLSGLMDIYRFVEADDTHISGLLRQIFTALYGTPLVVLPPRSASPGARRASKLVEAALDPRIGVSRVGLIDYNSRVYRRGIQLVDYRWDVRTVQGIGLGRAGGRSEALLPVYVGEVPPTLFRTGIDPSEPSEYGRLLLAKSPDASGRTAVPISETVWGVDGRGALLTTGDPGAYHLAGALRSCLFWYLVRRFNATWWSEFNELYPHPIVIGRYDEGAQEEEIRNLVTLVSTQRRGGYGVFSQETDVEYIQQTKAGQVTTYDGLLALARNEISVALVGQIGTVGREAGGSHASDSVLMSVKTDVVRYIAALVEESLNNSLVPAICRVNLGDDFAFEEMPRVSLAVRSDQEALMKAQTLSILAGTGLPISQAYAYNEFAIPPPQPGDALLVAAPNTQADTAAEAVGRRSAQTTTPAPAAGATPSEDA